MVTFCSTVQRVLLINLCQKSQLWVDFKTEFVLIFTFVTSAADQEQENKFLYIAMKKWRQLQQTPSKSKSEAGQGDYQDKTQKLFQAMTFQAIEYQFLQVLLRKDWSESLTCGLPSTMVCMEFDLSI